jgi:tol-pal system beta propeller repeat protein TolB
VNAILLLLFMAGCNMPAASTPTPDLLATLQASTPLTNSTPQVFVTSTPLSVNVEQSTATPTPLPSNDIPSPSAADGLTGHIVFTCQVFKETARDQICIMNADGTGFRRLTNDDSKRHFYPSLSPDGKSVLYSTFVETDNYDIYEMELDDGSVKRITRTYGVETAPEFSPDQKTITYARSNPANEIFQVMLAEHDGGDPGNIPSITGWDPTWSPDGKRILFASNMRGPNQLFTVKLNGNDLQIITSLPSLRGRSDWSPDGGLIVTYSGESWLRELYIMNADGGAVRQLTPSGGNSQGPSFSPDGQWVAFTAYFDNYGDDHGCEIYVIRIDGTDLRRLTNNAYCDYQPRWGP